MSSGVEKVFADAEQKAHILAALSMEERSRVVGWFGVKVWEGRPNESRLLRDTIFPNLVMTVGKNLLLDTGFAGSAYTVTGPFMFLVSATSFSAYAAADTMASHAGWLEAGNANAPTYTSPRKTVAFSSASGGSKTTSAALNFAMTGSGTVQGAGLVYGSGAVSTIDSTAGTLWSAGTFTGGTQPVINGNTLAVTYTTSM
jgi:hypothetical protein